MWALVGSVVVSETASQIRYEVRALRAPKISCGFPGWATKPAKLAGRTRITSAFQHAIPGFERRLLFCIRTVSTSVYAVASLISPVRVRSTAKSATGSCPGQLPSRKNAFSSHEDVVDAHSLFEWVSIASLLSNLRWVHQHHVCHPTPLERAAVIEAKPLCRISG